MNNTQKPSEGCLHPRGMLITTQKGNIRCAKCKKLWVSDEAIQATREETELKTVNSISEQFDEWWYSLPAPRTGKVDGVDAAIKLQLILDNILEAQKKGIESDCKLSDASVVHRWGTTKNWGEIVTGDCNRHRNRNDPS